MGVPDAELVDPTAATEDERCPICKEVFLDPCEGKGCQHAFCRACLEACIATKPECPMCKATMHEEDIGTAHRHLRATLARLLVRCTVGGCFWTGRLDRRAGHTCIEDLRTELRSNLTGESEGSPLQMAAFLGHPDVVHRMLQNDKTEVNALDKSSGFSALHLATHCGHLETIRQLLQSKRLVVNTHDRVWGSSALHIAVDGNHSEVVGLLLQHDKVEVNLFNKEGLSALHVAAHRGHSEVVRQLLQSSRLEVNACESDTHSSALHIAAGQGHSEVVRLLLQHDTVEVNLLNKDGVTALH
eukprot:2457892-Amphidinium_carterae.1